MSEILRVGIVGDGQLGRMMVEDGLRYNSNLEFTVLGTAGPDSPAAQVGARQLDGGLKDPDMIRTLVEQSDVTTWEIEHIDAATLMQLEDEGHNIQPSPRSLLAIQDKLRQKEHLQLRGIPVAPFAALDQPEDLASVRKELGDDLMVKRRKGGYDGRGNYRLKSDEGWDAIEGAFSDADEGSLYAEKIIPFSRELALVGARDMLGAIATYPVVETIHQNSICHTVYGGEDMNVPAAAERLGRDTIATFAGAGVFAVEMFETKDGDVLVNEVAPRVHNSGHWTDVGADTSQFEQQIRAITGDQLGSTKAKGAFAMMNLLYTKDGIFKNYMRGTTELKNGVGEHIGHVRWYGKAPRPGAERKIGHISVVSRHGLVDALIQAQSVHDMYTK